MPWHIVSGHSECGDGKFAVVKDSDGSVVACHDTKQQAKDHLAALYANDRTIGAGVSDRLTEVREFVHAVDRDLRRTAPFEVESVRTSGNPEKKHTYYVRGTASVFNRWSLDLGGFRERILPGAFDSILREDPHVVHVIDHDTSKVLSSTENGTLKLTADENALHYDSSIDGRRTYAADLQLNLEMGLIKQSSFAFTVPEDGDEWRIAEDGVIERDVKSVDGLYDVTTCAMGAYPQTEAALAVRTLARGLPLADVRDKVSVAGTSGADGAVAPAQVGGPDEGVAQDAGAESAARPLTAEEREARERERRLWKDRRRAEYLRTREFAFGVNQQPERD